MKKFLAMAAALTMSLSVAAVASAAKYEMTFSTAVSQEQSSTIYMDKALDLITERTNGDVTFSRTYSGTLGSELHQRRSGHCLHRPGPVVRVGRGVQGF